RYGPRSRFPAHDHPQGEEILVLEGVFSDEHGDWPAGTFLLNPEGFRHAPFSEPGCVLFVKLRQFPGRERSHIVIDTHKLAWEPSPIPAVAYKTLYQQAGFSDLMRLERWQRSEEHTSELQSRVDLVCRLLLEKKKKRQKSYSPVRTNITRQSERHR